MEEKALRDLRVLEEYRTLKELAKAKGMSVQDMYLLIERYMNGKGKG